ncbi:MAG: hypothetical protein ABIF85_00655 [Nanoarchaeota archaeon]|nr:hypothetical protein [Nanoarchaeota archaeon]MBU4451794.1 hypothetical protein [Nanoarchaeota archaeon]
MNDKSLLNLAKIVETKKSTLEGEKKAGTMTFHKIELFDADKEKFLNLARTSIKDKFYLHICSGGVMVVVYKNSMFEFSKNDCGKINEARDYGAEHGILREQMDFEVLVDAPWA